MSPKALPRRMRASAADAFGKVPTIREMPVPALRPGQLLVRLNHAAVNPVDWKILDGAFRAVQPHDFPLIPGVDGAGTIEAISGAADGFEVGEAVFGLFWETPIGHGTFAEFATISADGPVHRIPSELTHAQAAALPTAGLAALVAMDSLDLSAHDSLLIIGATGGVGTVAIQLAASRGYEVLATARPDARALVKVLGAREVVDYSKGKIGPEVLRIHPEGVDGILDLHSESIADFRKNLSLLARDGVAIKGTGEGFEKPMEEGGRRFANLEVGSGTREMMDRLCHEITTGSVHAVVSAHYSLDQVDAALDRNRRGGARGKTVIEV
jgi:NADPH:quinone reductase